MHIFIKKHWFFFLTLMIALFIWFFDKNHDIFLSINSCGHLFSKPILNFFNAIADFDLPVLPIILVLIVFCRRREKFLHVIILILAFFVIFDLLKFFVHEPRPYIQYHIDQIYWLADSKNENFKSAYRSFPSGHTGNVAIFVFTLYYLFAANKIWLQCLLVLPLIFIMLVRILTGWHFPLDVLCASLIAYVLVLLIMNMPLKLSYFQFNKSNIER